MYKILGFGAHRRTFLLLFLLGVSAPSFSSLATWNDYYNYWYANLSCGSYNQNVYYVSNTRMNLDFSVYRAGVAVDVYRKQAGNGRGWEYPIAEGFSQDGVKPNANVKDWWSWPKYISNRGGWQDYKFVSHHYKHFYWDTTRIALTDLQVQCTNAGSYTYY